MSFWQRVRLRLRNVIHKLLNPRAIALGFGILLLFALVIAAVFVLPERLVPQNAPFNHEDRVTAVNDVRTTLLQAVAGVLLVLGAVSAYRQLQVSQNQLSILHEGQITERFSRAVDHLGREDNLSMRLGGIYALERIADTSWTDSGPIAEILCAYIREKVPATAAEGDDTPIWQLAPLRSRWPDLQAIVTVLGRRRGFTAWRVGPNVYGGLDLKAVDLRAADFNFANLSGVEFEDSVLSGSHFALANLSEARFDGAVLIDANFQDTDLTHASLRGVDSREANFYRTNLNGANFNSANLHDTHFQQADLRDADLIFAKFGNNDFYGADLRGADLREADLRTAKFETTSRGIPPTRLDGAFASKGTSWPDTFDFAAAGVILVEYPGPGRESGFSLSHQRDRQSHLARRLTR